MNPRPTPSHDNGEVDLTDTQVLKRFEKKLDDTHLSLKESLDELQSGVYERRNGQCQSPTIES